MSGKPVFLCFMWNSGCAIEFARELCFHVLDVFQVCLYFICRIYFEFRICVVIFGNREYSKDECVYLLVTKKSMAQKPLKKEMGKQS